MKASVTALSPTRRIATFGFSLLLCLPLLAQHEQTPVNIDRAKTVKETTPPIITFNNYNVFDLKVENTYGAAERFFTAAGSPPSPGDLKTVVINNEWGTLKATPCQDGSLTSCASTATLLANGPSVTIDTKQYILQQFHFHAPSEHTVDGKLVAMEIHFVHLLNNGCAADDHRPGAVLGAFIVEGVPDPEIGKFFDSLGSLPRKQSEQAKYVSANLGALLPAGKYTWRYDGALTAPAGAGLCGGIIPESIPGGGTVAQQLVSGVFPEVVHWFLYDKPLRLSRDQIQRFKELFPEGNARAIKENGNSIYETVILPAVPPVVPPVIPPVTNPTSAVANPKNATVTTTIVLDGSASIASDGKPLTYSWKSAPGGKNASIVNATSVNPLVQFTEGYGNYIFELTVTDSTGIQAKDTTTILYIGR